MTTTLVPIDGSQSAQEAMKYAARSRPGGDLLLLYVAPSARMADLERGRFLLENSRRQCEVISRDVRIETRLEIGDPRTKLPEVAADADCDLVVMGAYGVNALPHVDRVSPEASELTEEMDRPVVLVLPTGQGFFPRATDNDTEDEEEEQVARQA